MNHFLSLLEVKTFLITTSEEIHKKNLLDFCKTQLYLNDYTLESNDFLNANYITESNKYFIYTTKNITKSFYFEYLDNLINEYEQEYVCFIVNTEIYVYKNKSIYYFQQLNFSLDENEIKNLIFEILNITLDCIININDDFKYEDIFLEKSSITKIKNINKKKQSNYFKLFVASILVAIVSCIYYYNQEEEKTTKLVAKYIYKSKKINDAITFLNLKKIDLEDIKYDGKLKLNIKISMENYSEKLIEYLKIKFKILNFNYDNKLDLYKVELHVK